MKTQPYTIAWRIALSSCILLLMLIGLASVDLIARSPLLYLVIGFLLSVSLRQLALMTAIRRWARENRAWLRRHKAAFQ